MYYNKINQGKVGVKMNIEVPKEPDLDAPQAEWDEYEKKMNAIPDTTLPYQFKSIEQQKAERQERLQAERQAEIDALPVAVKRAALKRKQDELTQEAGGYVDGGFANDEQASDAKALRRFEEKSSKSQRQALARYVIEIINKK